jgi:hypothetical protein
MVLGANEPEPMYSAFWGFGDGGSGTGSGTDEITIKYLFDGYFVPELQIDKSFLISPTGKQA